VYTYAMCLVREGLCRIVPTLNCSIFEILHVVERGVWDSGPEPYRRKPTSDLVPHQNLSFLPSFSTILQEHSSNMVRQASVISITQTPFINKARAERDSLSSPTSPTSSTSSTSSSPSTSPPDSLSAVLSYSEGIRIHTQRQWEEERKHIEELHKRKHGHSKSNSGTISLSGNDVAVEAKKQGGMFRGRRRSVHA